MKPSVNVVQVLPKEQVKVLLDALQTYGTAINTVKSDNTTEVGFLQFDIMTLQALLKYDVKIVLSFEDFEKFSQDNGIDFPIYSK